MYAMTRGPITLLAAGFAGALVWATTHINDHHTGGYWAVYGILAGAGLVMALSQLLGGWTKWGVPRVSPSVLVFALVPVVIVVGWILVAGQPHGNTTRGHVLAWSSDLGLRGLVRDLTEYVSVLAFGLGLVFGFTFDTSGPRRVAPAAEVRDWRAAGVRREPATERYPREGEPVGASTGPDRKSA